ncbi:MAG: TRAP transporter permease DctQ [Alcaligenaceae bacterium]|nr:MAG: TRAP transporter permease DctQ [Alcaligenaceae bacterium]
MKNILLAVESVTTRFSLFIACLMMALAATLGMFQVVMRFILEIPAEWTEVLIRFSLVWMVFMGIPYAFRVGAMVSVDVLYRVVGARGKRVFDFVTSVAALTLVAVIIWWGWDYSNRGRVQTVIGLESISMFWAYLALPVGGLFCVPAILANFFDPQRNELENAQ